MQADNRTPYSDKPYILYLGDDGYRFMKFCELMHRLPNNLPVIGIKCNSDPDNRRRLQTIMAIRRLKIDWRIILLTPVPREDVLILMDQAVATICPDLYNACFQDGMIIDIRDVDKMESKLSEVIYGKQDI